MEDGPDRQLVRGLKQAWLGDQQVEATKIFMSPHHVSKP
jgi:hypothetical protein